MLGLVSHANLMDALIHPHRQVNSLNFFSISRPSSSLNDSSESDAIIEDTPDSPVETTDYSSKAPDVGQTVTINHDGSEISVCDTQRLNKRVFFSYHNESDPDEYPFHAVTYGESEGCWGLPYNDHNYASYEPNPDHNRSVEPDDRLSLLAKLALAKDDDAKDSKETTSRTLQSTLQTNWVLEESSTVSTTKSVSLVEPSALCPSTRRSVVCNSGLNTPSNGQSLVTTTSHVSSLPSRTILISTAGGNANPPLQIHRVSSSLTPHVILRTGLPGLQISTTAPRQVSTDSMDSVRCVCGNTNLDGYLVQCNQCRIWHHSECISSASKSHLSTPYVCEICQTQSKAIATQRPHLTAFNSVGSTTTPNIRISRAPIGTNTSSGRVFLTNTFGGVTHRQVHVCIPANQGMSNVQCENGSAAALPPNYGSCGRSVRSSKRKQDLLTLTGGSSSANAGIEGFSSSPPVLDDYDDLSNMRPSYATDLKSCFMEGSLNVCQTQGSHPIPVSDKVQIRHSSIVHRLITDCPNNKVQNASTQVNEVCHTSPPCSAPDSVLSPPSDIYEEAQALHLSSRVCKKLSLMFPLFTGIGADCGDIDGIFNEEIPSNLERLFRYQVVSFDFNRRGLIANEDICPRTPIIEYRGNCLLLSEYNDMYDYRKHYNPFVLFYKSFPKLPLCVDARKYGNEARFIRRSCTPNSEVRHCISFSDDQHNGPVPHLRLIVVASRVIPKSSEITLPFDFDYTACRYLVKCACVLKGCPITRWFQRMNQLSNPLRSSTRHSLVCTRKLPHSPHSYGVNGHSRGLSLLQSSQSHYDDKDPSDEQSVLCPKSSVNTNLRNLPVNRTGRYLPSPISNERTSGSHQIGSNRTTRGYLNKSGISCGVRKAIHRRGRGRGRLRSSSSLGVRSKRETERLSSRIVYLRKSNSKSLTTARKRRSQRNFYSHSGQHPVSSSSDSIVNVEKKRDLHNFSGKSSCSYEIECLDRLQSVPVKASDSPQKSFNRDNQEVIDNTDIGCKSNNELLGEDLDADTEPEYDVQPEKLTDRSVGRKYVQPNSRQDRLNSKGTKESYTSNNSPRQSDLDYVKAEMHESHISKRKSVDSSSLVDRRKRRSQISTLDDHFSKSRKRSTSIEQKEDKKSKEDVWMAEVLRRIERMEKKRLKQRVSSISLKSSQNADCTKNHPNLFSPTEKSPEPDSISDNNDVKSTDGAMEPGGSSDINSKALECDKDNKNVIINETYLNDLEPTNVFEKPELFDCESNHCSGLSQNIKQDKNISPSKACNQNISEESDTGFQRKQFKQFTGSKFKYQKHCSVSHKQRRRRSQAAMLSDSLSSVDQGGSREDRWLQMQLRRIAELSDHQEVSQLSSDMENISDKSHMSSGNRIKDGSNMRVTLFEALGVKSESPKNDHNPNSCLQHLPPNLSKFNIASGCDTTVFTGGHESSNQINSNQQALDSDADCGFIVYRTREKDPMAKFSRTRSLDMHSLFPTIHDEISEKTVADTRQDVYTSVDDMSTSCLTQPFMHQTPRPTKKRWLSRALMEEDVESSHNNFSNCSHSINHSLSTKSDSSLVIQNSCATPVNPKKRIISRLSGISEDLPICTYFESDDNLKKESVTILSDRLVNNPNDEQVICNPDCKVISESHEDTEFCDALSTHLAPLPPKKATVKQQAEELRLQEIRKVRVSLSEYRRRRGLPALTSSAERNHKQTKEPLDQSNGNIDNLEIIIPPTLISPDRLLITLPNLHNESKPSSDVKCSDGLLQKITSLNIKPEVLHDFNQPLSLYTNTPKRCEFDGERDFIDAKVNERGPRTPSEPPDDDEDIGVDSINPVSRGALSSSPEPFIRFPGKVLSSHSSPTSAFSDSRIASEKLPFRNSSPPDVNSSKFSDSCFRDNMFTSSKPINRENLLHDIDHTKECDQVRIGSEVVDQKPSVNIPVSTKEIHFDRLAHYYKKTFNLDDSQHLYGLVISTGTPPPPPPPPIPSFSGHPVSSNSPVAPSYDIEKNPEDNPTHLSGSLEYFIQRDNEIRVWQETRSYEREKRNTSPWHHRVSSQPYLNTKKFSCTISKHPSKYSKNNEGFFFYPDIVTGHFDNVEQTLLRIRDSLQAQLDLTKVGCASQKMNSNNDRSSTNNNGAVC